MTFEQYMLQLGHSYMGLTQHGGKPACYCTTMPLPYGVNTPKKFHKAIELACQESQKGLLLMSIAVQDGPYEMWLEELKHYPEATITPTVSRHHGGYPCWFVCLPLHD